MSTALYITNFCACAIVLCAGMFLAINNMSRCTDRAIRWAWILLTTGAFGVLIGIVYGNFSPSIADVALHVGVAIFAFSDRRRYRRDGARGQRNASRT